MASGSWTDASKRLSTLSKHELELELELELLCVQVKPQDQRLGAISSFLVSSLSRLEIVLEMDRLYPSQNLTTPSHRFSQELAAFVAGSIPMSRATIGVADLVTAIGEAARWRFAVQILQAPR